MSVKALLLCSLSLLTACGSRLLSPPDRPFHPDDRPIEKPRSRDPRLVQEIIDKGMDYQLKQALDLPRTVRKLTGHPYQALDVDPFDEAPNSSWFTNRNGRRPLSLEEIHRGPNRETGPDTTGPWQVISLKSAGVTPGMTIVDPRGHRYILKFDPPDFPELASGAELVASRLFHAAGYNVPENYIAHLPPSRLTVAPEARIKIATLDKRQPLQERPMTREDLEQVLRRANPAGRERIRVLASRFLPGTPVGPWSYTGTRTDDANDIYPHEHRRSVRGLYVIASWINHADMKEENTLDMYDPERRRLTHYLIDFGASLGSNSTNPSNPRRGRANSLDIKDSLLRLFTLGLYVHDYERAPRIIHFPSVGYLGNDLFRADGWKPMYPVPAFENLTLRDAFWSARIVTSFSDAQIETAVAAGQFSNPDAAADLVRFLRERRDRLGRYWFARVNPLDRFEPRGAELRFADLAILHGYADASRTRYQYAVHSPQDELLAEGTSSRTILSLEPSWNRFDYVVVSLLPQRPNLDAKPILVYLRPCEESWTTIGLRRFD